MSKALLLTSPEHKGGGDVAQVIRSHLRQLYPDVSQVLLLHSSSTFINRYLKNSGFLLDIVVPDTTKSSNMVEGKIRVLDQLAEDLEVVIACYPERDKAEFEELEKWATTRNIRVDRCSTKRGRRHVIESNSLDDPDLVCSPGVPKVVGMRNVLLKQRTKGKQSNRVREDD